MIHHAVFHWTLQYHDPSLLSSPPAFKLPVWTGSIHPFHPPTHLSLLITLPHFLTLCGTLPSNPPICAPSPPPYCTLNLSYSLPPLLFPLPSVYSHSLGSSHSGSQGRDRELFPLVGDPCQGDKLPTTACLHSWKIKNLWRREGPECLCVCMYVCDRVREVLIDQCVCVCVCGKWSTDRSVYVCVGIKSLCCFCLCTDMFVCDQVK